MDAKGRTWAATQAGLFIYTKDGKPERGAKPIVKGDIFAVALASGSR
ncbi:hypothetical protein ACFL6C_12860 [Myxococcota bacterium]